MARAPVPVRWTLRLLAAWLAVAAVRNAFFPEWDAAPVSGRAVHVVVLAVAGALLALRAVTRREERLAWALIAAGVLAWTAGETYFTTVLWTAEDIPMPSPADVGYLLAPPLLLLGLVTLLRGRATRVAPTAWADGLAAALAVGAVSAAVVLGPVAGTAPDDPLGTATTLAYPLWDLVLISFVVGAMAGTGWRLDRTWALVIAGTVVFWLADSLYLVKTAAGTFTSPSWFDAGWWAGLTCLAAAGWQPVRRHAGARPGLRLIVMPLLFGATGLGLLVVAGFTRLHPVAIVLAAASLLAVMARLVLTFREHLAVLEASRRESETDALTGLGNRRGLTGTLDDLAARATAERPVLLALFDLDGFKAYNDAFGHPAGDLLLARLGTRLTDAVHGRGRAFRMGGDEFCLVAGPGVDDPVALVADAAEALAEHGEGFEIGCSWGAIALPSDAGSAEEALRLADQRMYAQKSAGRVSASRQSRDVLLQAVAERHPTLDAHVQDVAVISEAVARALGLPEDRVEQVRHAAELHDVGKVAVPDAILDKPGPLDADEWAIMRRHTLVGERIIMAAPALLDVARLVRASHERWDGGGYPDGLAGEAIPLGSRIVAVADAFEAMVATRPYSAPMPVEEALAELRRCAGRQFDPAVVEAFTRVRAQLPLAA